MWIPTAYAQVNMKWSGSGVPLRAQTTFAVTCPSGALPVDVRNVVVTALQQSAFTQPLSTDVKIEALLIKVGPNETGPMAEFGVDFPGGAASTAVPPNTAVLVKKATALGGRKAQGRYFLPGIPETSVSQAGLVEQSKLTALQTAQNSFLGTLTGGGMAMYLLHTMPSSPVPPYAVMSLSVSSTVATQRRRLRH